MKHTRRSWLALAASALPVAGQTRPSIHPGHPRLFFRGEPWGRHNLTLDEVRRRGQRFAESLTGWNRPDSEAAPNLALRYVITGDEQYARSAIEQMKLGWDNDPWTTTQGDQIEAIATAYDWLRGTYDDFPASDRAALEQLLVDGARLAIRNLSSGASMYHTRMYAWANAILFAGLALHGDRDEAEEFIDFGWRYYDERLLPSRRHLGGAWFNAMSYGKKYTCRSVLSMATAWRSATGEDLWKRTREQEEDWLRNMLYFLMYTLRPDHQFAGYGDMFNSMIGSHQGTMRLLAQAASETRDPFIQGFLEEIRRHWGGPQYDRMSKWYQVFEDPSIPSRPRSELPLWRVFGRQSLGMVLMRSGWGPDDTWALFKCGDYGDNHGHFDQGHFEIFRQGQLALDHYYGCKATKYHNTILVSDRDDPDDPGNQRDFSRQVHASFESYRADETVETGNILDIREDGADLYVLGDLTPAYPRDRVERCTRLFAFLDRRDIVIFDVVTVANDRFEPRFQVNYPNDPAIDGQRASWTNGGGELTVQTLLPDPARLTTSPPPGPGRSYNPSFQRYWPAGRLVVRPAAGESRTTYFLHVLFPRDKGGEAPKARLHDAGDVFELRVGDKAVRLDKSGRKLLVG